MRRPRFIRAICLTVLTILLAACASDGDVSQPIPTQFFAATQPAQRLVVVLPGRGDDLNTLNSVGIASTIQQSWPDADVMLSGLSMSFYRQGRASQRLHEEIIQPARQRGAAEIWLVGVSLGGMGAILYDREYPGQVDGIVLLSPYLGGGKIAKAVRNGGGLAQWQPGPTQEVSADTYQHELWRTLKGWSEDAGRRQSVWLACGSDERLLQSVELMAPALPTEHLLIEKGKHNWAFWIPALRELLRRAERL